MRSSDWSSDVCSSDLFSHAEVGEADSARPLGWIVENTAIRRASLDGALALAEGAGAKIDLRAPGDIVEVTRHSGGVTARLADGSTVRSEEHTSELQSLMRISYAVFCLKKKKTKI